MPLRLRLGLLFALATAAVIAVVGGGFLLQLRDSLDATLDAGLTARAAALADQYSTQGVAGLRLTDQEQPTQLVSSDGHVLASSPGLTAPVIDAVTRAQALDRARRGDTPLTFTVGAEDDRTRYQVVPVRAVAGGSDGQVAAVLVVGAGTDIADDADENVERGLMLLGPPTVLAAGFGAWLLAGATLRPVERMRRQTAEISEHDSDTELAVPPTRDEIAALARTMNGLLARLRAALAHERGFVADAGHELRTPLATLRAELELAARPGRSITELQTAVGAAGEETDRLIRLAEDLLLLARAQGDTGFLHTAPTELVTVLAAAARAASAAGDARNVDVVVDAPTTVTVLADADRLRQAVDNLLANAVRFSPAGGLVTLTADLRPERVVITVADQGPGFPVEFLPHAFERFRRADTARARAEGGTGLGLAIVDAVATAHEGRAVAANRPGGGAEVTIDLPRPTEIAHPDPVADGRCDAPTRR